MFVVVGSPVMWSNMSISLKLLVTLKLWVAQFAVFDYRIVKMFDKVFMYKSPWKMQLAISIYEYFWRMFLFKLIFGPYYFLHAQLHKMKLNVVQFHTNTHNRSTAFGPGQPV